MKIKDIVILESHILKMCGEKSLPPNEMGEQCSLRWYSSEVILGTITSSCTHTLKMYHWPLLTQGYSTFPALSLLNSASKLLPRRMMTRYISSVVKERQ